jgi:hypothetical protein
MEPEARKPARSVRLSLVGWGKGEGEEAGAILRVFWPWGFFLFVHSTNSGDMAATHYC